MDTSGMKPLANKFDDYMCIFFMTKYTRFFIKLWNSIQRRDLNTHKIYSKIYTITVYFKKILDFNIIQIAHFSVHLSKTIVSWYSLYGKALTVPVIIKTSSALCMSQLLIVVHISRRFVQNYDTDTKILAIFSIE